MIRIEKKDVIKTIIIEDEIAGQELLKKNIANYYPQLHVVAVENTVQEAIESINFHKPDLIFLDIHIKGGSGFDVLDKFKSRLFDVIFVTAYSNFAIQAIKENALDYIVKPLNKKEFCEAVDKILRRKNQMVAPLKKEQETLTIQTATSLQAINYSDILFLEADGPYTKIYLTDKLILSTKHLGDYELILPKEFFYRTHHSFIVNITKIKKLSKARSGTLYLLSDYTVPVSQRKLKEFSQLLDQFNVES